jgi:hypothetical protein
MERKKTFREAKGEMVPQGYGEKKKIGEVSRPI